MAPAFDAKSASESSTCGRVQSRLTASSAKRGGDVEFGERRAEAAQNRGAVERGAAQRLEHVKLASERAVGGGGDARIEFDQRLRGEAHRALHGLAMDEGLDMRRLQQRLADRLTAPR